MQIISNEKGFSLIELTIIMLIVGITLASIGTALRVHRVNQEFSKADTNISNAQLAINQVLNDVGRYPCPANPTIAFNSPSFGYEDCTWARAQGILGSRNADGIGGDDQILIGYLPLYAYQTGDGTPGDIINLSSTVAYKSFREKGKDISDPWNISFTYIVSDTLTNISSFNPDNGVIQITDETGSNTGGTTENAHYLILSPGENGYQCEAWNPDSVMTLRGLDPNDPAEVELYNSMPQSYEDENCDGDYEFKYALQSGVDGDNFYDDRLRFDLYESTAFWSPTTNESDSDDLFLIKDGKLSLGPNYRLNPNGDFTSDLTGTKTEELKLDVDGNVLAEEMLAANIICDDENLNNGSCIKPETFKELECPDPGQYMSGITILNYGLSPICEDIVFQVQNADCDGQYVNGMYTDGNLVCQAAKVF